jgi:hypothetical protein
MIDEIALGSFAVSTQCRFFNLKAWLNFNPCDLTSFSSLCFTQNILSFAVVALLIGYHYFAANARKRND